MYFWAERGYFVNLKRSSWCKKYLNDCVFPEKQKSVKFCKRYTPAPNFLMQFVLDNALLEEPDKRLLETKLIWWRKRLKQLAQNKGLPKKTKILLVMWLECGKPWKSNFKRYFHIDIQGGFCDSITWLIIIFRESDPGGGVLILKRVILVSGGQDPPPFFTPSAAPQDPLSAYYSFTRPPY